MTLALEPQNRCSSAQDGQFDEDARVFATKCFAKALCGLPGLQKLLFGNDAIGGL